MTTVKLETIEERQARLKKNWPDPLQTAKGNIVKELKATFPGVKFSVKSDRFSGGDSIDVDWVDGPTVAQVDAIIQRYKSGSFDGMQDLYTYNSGEAREFTKVYGDAKYVFGSRQYSREAMQKVVDHIGQQYGIEMPEVKVSEYDGHAFIDDEGFNLYTRDHTWNYDGMARQVINRTIRKLSIEEINVLGVEAPDYGTAANGCEIPM